MTLRCFPASCTYRYIERVCNSRNVCVCRSSAAIPHSSCDNPGFHTGAMEAGRSQQLAEKCHKYVCAGSDDDEGDQLRCGLGSGGEPAADPWAPVMHYKVDVTSSKRTACHTCGARFDRGALRALACLDDVTPEHGPVQVSCVLHKFSHAMHMEVRAPRSTGFMRITATSRPTDGAACRGTTSWSPRLDGPYVPQPPPANELPPPSLAPYLRPIWHAAGPSKGTITPNLSRRFHWAPHVARAVARSLIRRSAPSAARVHSSASQTPADWLCTLTSRHFAPPFSDSTPRHAAQ